MGTPNSQTSVSTKLQRIAELAQEAPQRAFLSLAHHIDQEFLREAVVGSHLELTLQAFGDRLVLLYGPNAPGPRVKSPGKQPVAIDWPHQRPTAAQVRAHRGNLGIKAGAGLIVLDLDDTVAEYEMLAELGTLIPTVKTGSGKRHYYCAAPKDVELPAKLLWKGKTAGEIQRTAAQQVVAPPSVHPKAGTPYEWLCDPRLGLQELPAAWRSHMTDALPAYVQAGDMRGHEADTSDLWTGPSPDELIRRALEQPGARMRRNGVHFRCAGCAAEGRDRARDNAAVFLSGRFTCTTDRRAHRAAIAEQLGLTLELDCVEAPLAEDQDETPIAREPECPVAVYEECPVHEDEE